MEVKKWVKQALFQSRAQTLLARSTKCFWARLSPLGTFSVGQGLKGSRKWAIFEIEIGTKPRQKAAVHAAAAHHMQRPKLRRGAHCPAAAPHTVPNAHREAPCPTRSVALPSADEGSMAGQPIPRGDTIQSAHRPTYNGHGRGIGRRLLRCVLRLRRQRKSRVLLIDPLVPTPTPQFSGDSLAPPPPPPQRNAELLHGCTSGSQRKSAERKWARQWPIRP